MVACSIHIRPEASRINTRATQYRIEHQQQILQRCVKVYQEFVVTSMNLPVEAWSSSIKAAAMLPLPSEAPVFSPPQRHWIQQMIALRRFEETRFQIPKPALPQVSQV